MATLANPHRIRVVAALTEERNYVSRLARELGISRALLQVHLRKLEAAGLVTASIEVSADGKAMKFYEVAPFALHLTPQATAVLVVTVLTIPFELVPYGQPLTPGDSSGWPSPRWPRSGWSWVTGTSPPGSGRRSS